MMSQTSVACSLRRIVLGGIFLITFTCSPALRGLAGASDDPPRASGGPLDPTFGNGGKVTTNLLGRNDIASAIAIQRDDKIVVVGTVYPPTSTSQLPDFGVVRYNADGAVDTSFGLRGFTAVDFRQSDDRAAAVAIQPDGKIVVAGTLIIPGAGHNTDFAVTRLNPDGTIDLTFGVEGKARTDMGSKFFEGANAMALQPDGKIVVGGTVDRSLLISDFAIVRYNPNGSIDTSFGDDGRVFQAFGPDSVDHLNALAVQPDGRILAVGYSDGVSPGNFDIALARYTPDGVLDPTFGNGGLVSTNIRANEVANAVALQGDGKIVVAGYARDGNGSGAFALARYHADGTLDSHFGIGGIVTTSFFEIDPSATPNGEIFSRAASVAIHADGKIVAFGDHESFRREFDDTGPTSRSRSINRMARSIRRLPTAVWRSRTSAIRRSRNRRTSGPRWPFRRMPGSSSPDPCTPTFATAWTSASRATFLGDWCRGRESNPHVP